MLFDTLARDAALRRIEGGLQVGHLRLIEPSGRVHDFSGHMPGATATIVLNDWRLVRAILRKADIGLGESYMAGWWDSPDLVALNTVLVSNAGNLGKLAWGSPLFQVLAMARDRFFRRNSIRGSRRNILAHYDLGNDFYQLWLDSGMSYSSAIYQPHASDLAGAQKAKYARILDRIGDRSRCVLEIGCGWGAFIASAAERDVSVTGLTISDQQLQVAKTRTAGISEVHLQDYRNAGGKFDAVVSIEMFEAVGERYWPDYFSALAARLKPKGIAVIQTIAIADELFANYRVTSDYIRHHVFPGGMLPSVERFKQEAKKQGLECRDVYSFGADYARTLVDWLARFDGAEQKIRNLGYSESFMRGWRFYLALSAGAFLAGRTNVHQIELVAA
jgi:cyclopropane-fatty-acyl-phospholipid synthase